MRNNRQPALALERESAASAPAPATGARVVKNTAVLIALRVGMPLLSVVLVLAVSRMLGSEDLGRYTLAFTLFYFFNTIAPLGLHTLITRDGARDRSALGDLLGSSLLLGTVASLGLTAVMALIGGWLGYDDTTRISLALLSLAILPSTLVTFFEGAFTALERMESIAYETIAENVLKVVGAIALLWAGYGLPAVIAAAVAGRVLACLVSFALLRRTGIRLRWTIDAAMLKTLLGAAPTFLLISIFATLYWRIDVFMLSQLRSFEDLGLYGAAYRLLELAMILPQSLCLAVYPRLALAAHGDRAELLTLGRTTLRWLLALTVPAAVCVTVLADRILTLLYGAYFHAADTTLAVLIWTAVPYAWVRYHAYVLVAAERQRVDLALNAVMALCNVLLNLWLIPAYGPLGAALATLVSICIYGLAQSVYLQRVLPDHYAGLPLEPATIKGAALAGLGVWLLADESLLLALAVAPAIYAISLAGAGFFTAAELRFLHLDRAFGGADSSARIG